MYQCATAHRAGLERDIQRRLGEPVIILTNTRLSEGANLGMCGRVVEVNLTVATMSQHLCSTG